MTGDGDAMCSYGQFVRLTRMFGIDLILCTQSGAKPGYGLSLELIDIVPCAQQIRT